MTLRQKGASPVRGSGADLRGYLLRSLDDDQQTRIEQRLFEEEGFLDEIELAEQELIDDYLDDALTPAERGLFESRFIDSPRRHRQVELATALRAAAGREVLRSAPAVHEAPSAASVRDSSWWAMVFGEARRSNVGRLAYAAGLVVLVAGLYWSVDRASDAARRARELEMTLSTERGRSEGELAALRRQLEDARASAAATPVLSIGVVLRAGIVRSGESPTVVAIPSDAETVMLLLDSPDPFAARSYRAVIIDATGQERWAATISRGNAPQLRIAVPPAALATGMHVLTVAPQGPVAQREDPQDFAFEVRRR
jgi:hypothetical protein